MKDNKDKNEQLQTQITALEHDLQQAKADLKILRTHYEIAVSASDVTVFDYDIKTKQILTQAADGEIFGMPDSLKNGVEDVLAAGIVTEKSQDDVRDLYHQIDCGVATAATTIYANDVNGAEKTLFLKMVTVFDDNGVADYAVGVRKDITDYVRFRREQEYSDLLTLGLNFIFEANVTRDLLCHFDPQWAKDIELNDLRTVSGVLQLMCKRYVYPADVAVFIEKQSPTYLLAAFAHGEHTVSVEYRKWVAEKGYLWFEAMINLVEDEITQDINMRVYVCNIDNKRKEELKAISERKWYEIVLSKSTATYEINVSKNTLNLGQRELQEKFDIIAENYIDDVVPVILKAIHPHEREVLAKLLCRNNLLEAFTRDQTDFVCEYRCVDKQGKYKWYRCSLQLFEDAETKDVIAYIYVEDINEEKEKQLALFYKAQHDLMTGFYNKHAVAEKINEILTSEDGKLSTHIFFIIDLDYFKLVNDKFGHAFGDAVLSQTSAKISALFRQEDVLGRIGGDEFVVFMKSVKNDKIAYLKAQEICDNVAEVYVHNGLEYKVTVSVGIAVCHKHGATYDALYAHSDTALYDAKERGRNCFSIYSEGMVMEQTAVNNIELRQIPETQTFESSICEYIFRILYESLDKKQAINSVLELMGKHYRVSRVYVFENSKDNLFLSETFEWCQPGIEQQITTLQNIPYAEVGDYGANFGEEGFFYVADVNTFAQPIKDRLQTKNIKSIIQFSILKKGRFAGFIGFDECAYFRTPELQELNDYRNFANILGVFIMEMRAFETVEKSKRTALSIVNGLDSYAYVCDPNNYQLLFANVKTKEFMPGITIGDLCYHAFWQRTSPCPDCPMVELLSGTKTKLTQVAYKQEVNMWTKMTTSWVDWLDEQKACLINITDITDLHHNLG